MLECFYRLSENSFFKTQVQEETTSETISNIAFKMMGFLSIALIYRFSDPLKTSIYFLAYEGKKLGKRFWLRSKVKSELKTWEALLLKFINKTPETNDARARSYNCLRNDLFLLTRPAENQLVTNLFNQYIPKGPLLELGSNLLNEKGESYLASLLPEEYRSDLIYSDCFKEIVEAEKEKPKIPISILTPQIYKDKSALGPN
ncbi:MAG: hypothetical protein HWD61_14150 [Parachlamydiaceae bacterium]|nr:MAG: hypothetical protein HWD61_14150 [Parachlamydiaceae bacterium]